MAQLLGRIDVEGLPCQFIDSRLVQPKPLVQRLAKLGQRLPVHQNACPLHLRQNRAKGQFHLVVDLLQSQFLQPLRKLLIEKFHQHSMACHSVHCGSAFLRYRHRAEGALIQISLSLGGLKTEIGNAEPLQVVAAVGRRQKIGGQGDIKHKAIGGKALGQKGIHQVLHVVRYLLNAGGEKAAEKVIVSLQPVRKKEGRLPPSLLIPLHGKAV